MAKSHTLLGCVTLFLTAAAPLAAEAPFTTSYGDTPISEQHDGFSSFKAVGVLSGVALFTALLKANDNSAAPSHNPVFVADDPSALGQAGSNEFDDNSVKGPIKNAAATAPEPGTLTLVASGLLGLAGVRRRKQT